MNLDLEESLKQVKESSQKLSFWTILILDYSLIFVNGFPLIQLRKGGIFLIFERIEAWCKENGTSVAALEKKCGLGNATIRGWETSNPRIDSLKKVSDITGIPISELISSNT